LNDHLPFFVTELGLERFSLLVSTSFWTNTQKLQKLALCGCACTHVWGELLGNLFSGSALFLNAHRRCALHSGSATLSRTLPSSLTSNRLKACFNSLNACAAKASDSAKTTDIAAAR
jgi:hypothetical protein